MSDAKPPSERTRLKRRPHRGHHDEATIFAILDAGLIAHVAMTIDGEPLVIPTAYWREGRRLYWHGSAAGRLATQAGKPVCVSVSHLDALAVGRSGIAHSVLYRSVIAFGTVALTTDLAAKRQAMARFIDRLYPGRAATIRPPLDAELQAITVASIALDEASAKIKDEGVNEVRAEDFAVPAWAGIIPLRMTVGTPQRDMRGDATAPFPDHLDAYRPGAVLDAVLARSSG